MSDEDKGLISKETYTIVVRRVSNGWIINDQPYPGEFAQNYGVARTARELAGYIQGWAERQEAGE